MQGPFSFVLGEKACRRQLVTVLRERLQDKNLKERVFGRVLLEESGCFEKGLEDVNGGN